MKSLIFSTIIVLTIINALPIPFPTPWFPLAGKPLQQYKIELNDSYQDQWTPIFQDFEQQFKNFIKQFQTLIPIPQFIYKIAATYGTKYFPYRAYIEELKAISEITGQDFGLIFVVNLLYDLTAIQQCTSIVYRNDQGRIIHGRNMDFPFMRGIAHISFQANVYRDGQLLYIGNGYAGGTGLVTGMRPGKYAITIDTRYTGSATENIADLVTGFDYPVMYFLRRVFETEDTFDKAVHRLSRTRTASPAYFVVSGVERNQGVIIEKERFGPHAIYRLNEDKWFLVQTNYDRDIDDPEGDMRRLPAEGRMLNLGNKTNEQVLLDNVLMKWPTLNIVTIYSITMCPATGYYNTTLHWS